MTYLQVHLLFVVPPLLALLAAHRLVPAAAPRRLGVALAAMVGIALVYTTPWDNYLVARGVWSYPPGRVSFTLGYVPFEEYLFFVLQTLLTGLWLALLWPRLAPRERPSAASGPVRAVGAALFGALAVAGVAFLTRPEGLYLGLVLVWAAPVLALQWGFGGDLLLSRWRLLLATIVPSTVYLSLADRFALARGIWSIAPDASTGVFVGGLPLEEGVFFLATNLMITLGLALVLDARSPARIAGLRRGLRPAAWRAGWWRAALVAWAVLMVPVPLLGDRAFVPLAYLSTSLLTLGALGLALERAGRRALPAALVAVTFGWGVELLGSRTGVPFGAYRYLAAGPELLGVPLLVPMGWF
ncbi:MAG: carotenoid biosynthesis protein, partial [Deinococcales bacterium]